MTITTDIAGELRSGATVADLLCAQRGDHERHHWSPGTLFAGRRLSGPGERARADLLRHTALTAGPRGPRPAPDGARLADEIRETNPLGADVLRVAAAWTARHWPREEARHAAALGRLRELAGLGRPGADERRGTFPTGNYARFCALRACAEADACGAYEDAARTSEDPLVRDVFLAIARDEARHRRYFGAFARALVDSGVHPVKDVLSVAYTWIRRTGDDAPPARDPSGVLSLVRDATGIETRSYDALRRACFTSLRTNDADRIRAAVHREPAA
ncbi:hypothetical protein ABZ760_18305 [Streptomyces sp. NPDC006658]|uniref:hypothetical protein n=1 Tax=Streptomyces sp. NPDC006658 TaxID=3156900 RepID=UPI0034036340